MERDYEMMEAKLKQDALAIEPIGFVSPGMLTPRGRKAEDA
jgi:transitional endoplasmic reticulum ATPase